MCCWCIPPTPVPVGTQVKLTVAPEDIQVMRKSDYSPDILKRHAARA